MATEHFDSKLAAIFYADVAGYSRLTGQDEEGTHRILRVYLDLMTAQIRQRRGTVVHYAGDAVLAEFASTVDALSCAVEFQRELERRNSGHADDDKIQFRIGINLGEVIIDRGDIYGNGVNIAARLESLADSGGICISQAVRDALGTKLPLDYEDMGAQTVKNIAEPVRAYRIRVPADAVMPKGMNVSDKAAAAGKKPLYLSRRPIIAVIAIVIVFLLGAVGLTLWWQPTIERADLARMAYALPDRPSIAVLPFDNMSTDQEQEYFADGISEDIITDLAKISGLFVIARNSSFAYKGKPVKIRQVAEDLGVRYVLEGSVRRSGDQIRITAQLIDALKGNHLWAERYDRGLKDVFAIQSEVTQHIVDALSVTLKAGEHERLFLKYTTNIEAYDVFLRARKTVDDPSRANIERGEELFRRVIDLDPNFAGGYAGLSFNYSVKARFHLSDTPEEDVQRSLEFARKAIELDRNFAWSHIALGGAYLAQDNPDAAVDAVRQALVIQPNGYEENLFMGLYLQFAGQSALAVEHLELAQRLSPVDTIRKLGFLGMAYFMSGDYEQAEKIWSKRLEQFPAGNVLGYVFLAATYTLLERPDEAASMADKLAEKFPKFNLSEWRWLHTYKSAEDRQRLYNAAKKAGIPEYPKPK